MKIENVIAAVNASNKQILKRDKRQVFRSIVRFGVDDNNRVTYNNFRKGFNLALSGPLLEVLYLNMRKTLEGGLQDNVHCLKCSTTESSCCH